MLNTSMPVRTTPPRSFASASSTSSRYWYERGAPVRSRVSSDGQIDFTAIFSKFVQYDFPGWAVVEWECVLKHPEDGAREGARFVREHIIRTTDRAFDDFA